MINRDKSNFSCYLTKMLLTSEMYYRIINCMPLTGWLRNLSILSTSIQKLIHGSSPPNFRGDLKISDQNNWGAPEQKNKFEGELNLRGDLKF